MPGPLVCAGAMLTCSMNVPPIPGALILLPKVPPTLVGVLPVATVTDFAPLVNIPSFGMCKADLNPTVIAAKAVGSPTGACVPLTVAPWFPGAPTALVGGVPALNASSTLQCGYGGSITVVYPAQTTVIGP